MRMSRYGWIGLLLLAVLLAACGGNDDPDADESESPGVEAEPTSLFPSTWTPVPTRTEPPRATIDYTYEAPITTPGVFPTRPPVTAPAAATTEQQQEQPAALSSPSSALPTSSPTQLVVSRDELNATIAGQFNRVAGGFFEAAPEIRFEAGRIIAALTVYTTPANRDTARPVVIEASALLEDNRVNLAADSVYFADDQTPYEDALAGYIVGAIETAVNDLLNQQHFMVFPDGGGYTITNFTITDTTIVADIRR